MKGLKTIKILILSAINFSFALSVYSQSNTLEKNTITILKQINNKITNFNLKKGIDIDVNINIPIPQPYPVPTSDSKKHIINFKSGEFSYHREAEKSYSFALQQLKQKGYYIKKSKLKFHNYTIKFRAFPGEKIEKYVSEKYSFTSRVKKALNNTVLSLSARGIIILEQRINPDRLSFTISYMVPLYPPYYNPNNPIYNTCGGSNAFGTYYYGGGCNTFGCWRAGGGCNTFGCWRAGGSCNAFGCTLVGECSATGCPSEWDGRSEPCEE